MYRIPRLATFAALLVVMCIGPACVAAPEPAAPAPGPTPADREKIAQFSAMLDELFKNKEYDLAADVCAQIAELDPKDSSIHYTHGLTLAKLGKADEAFAALGKAVDCGFGNVLGLMLHPWSSGLQADKRFATLQDRMLKVIAVKQPFLPMRNRQNSLGGAHARVAALLKEKKVEEAANLIRVMAVCEPGYPLVEYSKARLAATQGKKDEAFAHLAKSIEQGMCIDKWLTKDDELLKPLREDARMAPLVEKAKKAPKYLMMALYERVVPMEGVKSVEGKPEKGLPWRILMSPDATKEKPNRLVVWLHGMGGTGCAYVEPHAPAMLEKGFAMLVFPHKDPSKWSTKQISAAIVEAGKVEGIDNRKPVMMCYSLGGQRALSMWLSKPEQFGGLILNSAYPMDRKTNKAGKIELQKVPEKEGRKDVPILAIVGTRDGGMKVWELAEEAYPKLGIDLSVVYVPNAPHTFLMGKDRLPAMLKLLDKVLAVDAAKKAPKDAPQTPVEAPEE